MKDGGTRTLLIVALVAVGGVLLWLYAKGKAAQGGSTTGGIFGTVRSGWDAASGLTQDVTEGSVQTGKTLVGGAVDIADEIGHAGGSLNPANWSKPSWL